MKNFIFSFIFLFFLIPLVRGQATITVPANGELATKDWVISLVDSVMGKTSKPTSPAVQEPAKPAECDMRVDGYKVVGNQVHIDVYSAHANINPYIVEFEQDGKIQSWHNATQGFMEKLIIRGVKGTGTFKVTIRSIPRPGWYTTTTVTIKDNSTDSRVPTDEPPVVVPPSPNGRKLRPYVVSQGYDHELKLDIRDSAGVYLVSDLGTIKPDPGKTKRYIIGGQQVQPGGNLKNFIIEGNHPFRVVMMMVKPDLDNLYKWTLDRNQGGWFDHGAGQFFGDGHTGAFATVLFN